LGELKTFVAEGRDGSALTSAAVSVKVREGPGGGGALTLFKIYKTTKGGGKGGLARATQ